jgi:hypothetical protein
MSAQLIPAPAGLSVTLGSESLPVVALVLEPKSVSIPGDHVVRAIAVVDGQLEVAPRHAAVSSA